jgi:hypothetical protein
MADVVEKTVEAQKVLFTEDEIENYSKFLDGLIDFKKLLGDKNISFLLIFKINVGKILEKYDRTAYVKLFEFLNQLYSEGKISDEIGNLIKEILKAWDDDSQDELITVLATTIAGKVKILDNDTQETAFIKSSLMTLSALKPDLISSLHESYEKVIAKAE